MNELKKRKSQTELFYSRIFAIEQIIFIAFLLFSIIYISISYPKKGQNDASYFVLAVTIIIVFDFSLLLIFIVMLIRSAVIYSIRVKQIKTKENRKMCLRLMIFPIIFAFYYKYSDFDVIKK